MGDRSGIEWTDATWNPVTGCTRVSPGCANCYIERTPPFRIKGRHFKRAGNTVTTGVQLHPERLDQPRRWRRPRMIFTCSMSDLFHEEVSDDYIAHVWAAMAAAPQHTFQVLTKRPERMAQRLRYKGFEERIWAATWPEVGDSNWRWPLPNVWLGTSVENQYWADRRIPELLQAPAAVRFLSVEPLLKAVDLTGIEVLKPEPPHGPGAWLNALTGHVAGPDDMWPKVDWVIVGGESGSRARPMHPDWARTIRDQCQAAEVPFFFKQWGEWAPLETDDMDFSKGEYPTWPWPSVELPGIPVPYDTSVGPGTGSITELQTMVRKGKKAAGALLDGREWREFPNTKEVAVG